MRLSATLVLAAVGTDALLSAEAAEIRVLSAAAVQVPVEEIATAFARDTSHQFRFEFATAGEVEARVNAGARPAIVITAEERSAKVVTSLDLGPSQVRPLATVGIGVAARRGAPKPDLSSVDGSGNRCGAQRASLMATRRAAQRPGCTSPRCWTCWDWLMSFGRRPCSPPTVLTSCAESRTARWSSS